MPAPITMTAPLFAASEGIKNLKSKVKRQKAKVMYQQNEL